jgi:maleylpyruvate isomerase
MPASTTPTLYGFIRSGTSHRLRIALNLKGLHCEHVAIDLRTDKHLDEAYKSTNPQQRVAASRQVV